MSDEFSRNELPALANNCNVSRRHAEGHMAINISAYGHRPPTLALPGLVVGWVGTPLANPICNEASMRVFQGSGRYKRYISAEKRHQHDTAGM